MIVNAKIDFPCLLYTHKFMQGNIADEKHLSRAGLVQVNNGCFDSGIIIDKSGSKYSIVRYWPSNSKKPWNIYNIFPKNVFDEYKSVFVDMDLKFLEKQNLDVIRNEVINLVVDRKWRLTTEGNTKQGFLSDLGGVRSMQELIEKISLYNG